MFFSLQELLRSSVVAGVAAYVVGILLAGTVTALGSYRVVSVVLSELAPASTGLGAKKADTNASRRVTAVSQASRSALPERRAYMTPLQASMAGPGKKGLSLPRVVEPAFFGSSSRNWGRPSRRDRDEDDDEDNERPREVAGTYRTLCVRLCDGYYYPISFSATRDRFARDAKTCESSCGGQARLFVYRNPGADVEDMVDLRGQPYRQLSTAFLYRTEYVPQCRCKPNPWDVEARERHRVYALTADKRKGSKQAAAELDALTAKMKRAGSARPAQVALPAAVVPPDPATEAVKVQTADVPRRAAGRTDHKAGRMGLGARNPRETRDQRSRPSGGGSDWMARALGRNF